jgi:hypothetical protein
VPELIVSTDASPAPSLRIEHSGLPLSGAAWSTRLALDPGDYEVIASAAGYQDFRQHVKLQESAGIITLSVPALERTPAAEPVGALPTAPASIALEPKTSKSGPPTASWILFGAGAAALGTSAVLGLVAKSQYDSADCPKNQCATNADYDDRRAALSKATVASVAFALGVASAGAGAVVWAVSAHKPERPTAALRVRAGFANITLEWSL